MRYNVKQAVTLFVVLIVAVSVVTAQGTSLQLGPGSLEETFDDGNLSEYDNVDSAWEAQSDTVANGSHSLHQDGNISESEKNIISNETFTLDSNETFTVEFFYRAAANTKQDNTGSQSDCGGVCPGNFEFKLTDGTEDILIGRENDGTNDAHRFRVRGSLLTSEIRIGALSVDEWHKIKLTVDYSTDQVILVVDGTERKNTSISTHWKEPTNITARWRSSNVFGEPADFFWDTVSVESTSPKKSLELDVRSYMEHGTTQNYKVFEVKRDRDTGEVLSKTDVTDTATVTSGNTSVITVVDSDNKLVATSNENINEEVELTATNDSLTDTANVTVANKTLPNIGALPPATWPVAIFCTPGDTTGSTSTWPGCVQLQWIFVCMVFGAMMSWGLANPWLGLGTVEIMLLFGWAIDWVSDGLLMASIIFVVYAALSLTDIASGNLGPQTR